MTVAIIDLGLGNVRSVANMLDAVAIDCTIVRNPEQVANQDLLILPGVGSFDTGMGLMRDLGWEDSLKGQFSDRKIVGLCLGMQLLGISSEEGIASGLGLLPLKFEKIESTTQVVKVPHMGWNSVEFDVEAEKWFGPGPSRFYFVHSFASGEIHSPSARGVTVHGSPFVSIARNSNVLGLQFHPEKSHTSGKFLLQKICGGGVWP